MSQRYWLIKSEPTAYSIDDLKREKSTLWEGVRNYQARNFMMKEMKVGDHALFYHSSAEPPGAVGIAEVSGPAEPDPTQFDAGDSHYDPKATPANPIWYCVRVKFKQKFARQVSLSELRGRKELQKMVLLQKGSRLSIQPVTEKEFKLVSKLGSSDAGTKGRPRG
ncbi:MAG TPA: EVE domain-containing protein [Blastocatellia bacterium]|nr:EVE domain-containing protein [Blastocatellia bacterium]